MTLSAVTKRQEDTMDELPKKYCPFLKTECIGKKCALFVPSEESMVEKCAFAVIAQQLAVLCSKSPKGAGLP